MYECEEGMSQVIIRTAGRLQNPSNRQKKKKKKNLVPCLTNGGVLLPKLNCRTLLVPQQQVFHGQKHREPTAAQESSFPFSRWTCFCLRKCKKDFFDTCQQKLDQRKRQKDGEPTEDVCLCLCSWIVSSVAILHLHDSIQLLQLFVSWQRHRILLW